MGTTREDRGGDGKDQESSDVNINYGEKSWETVKAELGRRRRNNKAPGQSHSHRKARLYLPLQQQQQQQQDRQPGSGSTSSRSKKTMKTNISDTRQ